MPKKYHIHVNPTQNRYPVIGRSGIVDWGEGCLKCAVCVKQRCVYGVYKSRSFSADILSDTIDELCKSCFRCVQDCPKRLIHKTVNPEWLALGDDVYTPEIIAATWDQAHTGKIPVSGAGYGGSFSGPGFDSMWTDMSEIVRPTRDGIHGREYISTVIDIGRRPGFLKFGQDGNLLKESIPFLRIPMPIVFDLLPFGDLSPEVWKALAGAAATLQNLMIVPQAEASGLADFKEVLVPFISEDSVDPVWLKDYRMVEIGDDQNALERQTALKSINHELLISIRMPAVASRENLNRAIEHARAGFDLIHFVADERGYEPGTQNGVHLKDVIKAFHTALLEEGIRDEVTFMASGGIAMAEHVIKAMLCGANLVSIDVPLLIALECRVCRNCREGGECPVGISGIDPNWGKQRIINLIGAWHNQLLEMMGAMGIREARRLRGEQGRVMFMENLENETFGRLFGGHSK
jgi:ferredoxin